MFPRGKLTRRRLAAEMSSHSVMNRRLFKSKGFWLGLMGLFLAGCSTVPVTGRSGVNLVSDEAVVQMSIEQFERLKEHYPQSGDVTFVDMVRRVGGRIAKVAADDIPDADWEFVVFENPDALNAFVMTGGKVGVFTGLFRVVKSEDELAIVLGHEIAHLAAKHVNERLSNQILFQGVGVGLGILTRGSSPNAQPAVLDLYGIGSNMTLLGFSRKMEIEADHIGLIYAARAGYNPRAAIAFWERIATANLNSVPPEFLSTHPSYGTRFSRLHEAMEAAITEYEIARGVGQR